MLAGFLIGVLISVLYGIWAKFGGGFEVLEQFYATTISSWVPGQIVTLYHETSGIARMQGTASGPNAFGTFCMMGVFLLPFLRTKKLFKIVILAFLVFAIQQSYSRGVMLGTCVGALSLLALRYRVAWWKVLFVGATLVALVGSLFLWNEDFREDMLRRGGTSEHLTRPVAAIEIGWQSPWVGNLGQLGPAARMKNLRENNDDKALIAENVLVGIHFDTMIASYVINPGIRQHNLDYLAQHYLNHKMISFQDVVGKGRKARNFSEVEVEKACEYSCEDADITFRLRRILDEKMRSEKNEKLFYDLEMKLLPVLMDMEMTGIRIDAGFFREMSGRFGKEMKEMEGAIYAEAGMEFNLNSPQQLGYVLFEKLGLPGQKKTAKTKRYSTDVKVLKKLSLSDFKIPRLLLRYRTLSKLKSTYLDALVKLADPATGRVHTSYNQTVAATGRLSSSNPNLQNIPIRGEEGREIRKGFVAGKGHYLVAADYSQIELRVFAHYSGDEAFIEAFNQDQDIHTRTASEILGVDVPGVTMEMRRIAKAINFGIIYGMGPRKLSDELGIDHKTARDYISTYYDRYQGVVRYREEMIKEASLNGYVTTLFNRRRYLPDIQHANNRIRSEAERMAINTPIQGTAADLIKKAMINIHNRLGKEGFRSKMLLQVHDELVFETPEEELERLIPMIRGEMEGVFPLKVPLKVDINRGKNWDEAH